MPGRALPLRTVPPPAGHPRGLGHLGRRRPSSGPAREGSPLPSTPEAPLSSPRRGSVALTRLLRDETDTQPATPLAPPSALTVTTRALVPCRVPSRLTPRPLLSRARSRHHSLPPGPQHSGSAAGSFPLEDLCFKKQLRFLQRRKENKKRKLRVYSWTFVRCSPALPRSPRPFR